MDSRVDWHYFGSCRSFCNDVGMERRRRSFVCCVSHPAQYARIGSDALLQPRYHLLSTSLLSDHQLAPSMGERRHAGSVGLLWLWIIRQQGLAA